MRKTNYDIISSKVLRGNHSNYIGSCTDYLSAIKAKSQLEKDFPDVDFEIECVRY